MCYNFNTSLIAYIIGMMSALFALYTKQFILGMLILFYSQIQLSEAIIWRGIDTNNKSLNELGTNMVKYLLATHNIGISLGVLLEYKFNMINLIPLIISILFFISIGILYKSHKIDKYTYEDPETKRFKWTFPHKWYMYSFILSVILLIIYIKPIQTKIFVLCIYGITLLWYMIFYPTVLGSLWCLSAAILAPLVVFNSICF